MPALGLVREVAVTGIETFREKQQAANTITVFPEVVWMFKFIFVPLGVIGPDMLDFVTVLALAERTPRTCWAARRTISSSSWASS
jgi:hypothetical protein